MKLYGKEVRHNPLNCCSGTFHSSSQPRKPRCPEALVAQGTRGGQGKVLPPCGHFLVTTTALPELTGTSVSQALGSDNDSCSQDMSWGRNCRNKFQTQPAFRKPTATGKFSSHHSGKKQRPKPPPQDKKLSIPNYCRKINQNENKKSSPINPIRASSGGYKQEGKRARGKGTPLHSRWEGTWTTPSRVDSL